MNNTLILDKSLYSIESINQTISAYSEIVDVIVETNKEVYICIFNNSRFDTTITMKEFENYLIDISNKLRAFD